MSWWQSTVVLVLLTLIVLLVLLSPTRHDLPAARHIRRLFGHATAVTRSVLPKASSPGQGNRHGGEHSFLNARQDKALSLSIVPIMHHHNDQSRPNQSIESNRMEEVSIVWTAFFSIVEGRIGRVFSKATVRSPSKRHGLGTMDGFVSLPPSSFL
jgi:hypothetical protein